MKTLLWPFYLASALSQGKVKYGLAIAWLGLVKWALIGGAIFLLYRDEKLRNGVLVLGGGCAAAILTLIAYDYLNPQPPPPPPEPKSRSTKQH